MAGASVDAGEPASCVGSDAMRGVLAPATAAPQTVPQLSMAHLRATEF